MYGVNGEALQLHAVYEDIILHYKSRENLYQLLQVMRAASERAMKVEGLYDKIIITMHSTKLYWKKITRLLPLALLLYSCCVLVTIQSCDIFW